MDPVSYSECVSVRSDSVQERSYVSYCDLETPRRIKSCVRLERRLSPTAFRDTIVCYTGCSRKRYRSTSHCEFRVKPVNYRETCYVMPPTTVNTFVSFLDCKVDGKKWFKTSVEMRPKSYSSSLSHSVSGYTENEADTSGDESDVFSATPYPDPNNRVNGDAISQYDRLRFSEKDEDKDVNMNYKNANDTVEISKHFRIKLVVNGCQADLRNDINCNGLRLRSRHPPIHINNGHGIDGSVSTNGDIDSEYDNVSTDEDVEV